MEFNVLNEENKFKLGNIITIFKIPEYDKEFVLFSVSDFEDDDSSLHVAYLLKDKEGYDYIEEIEDAKVLKKATEAVKNIVETVN